MKGYKLLLKIFRVLYVKLGGSLITPKMEGAFEVREEVVREVSKDLKEISRKMDLFLAHGAGPFGHIPVKQHRLHGGYGLGKELGVSETSIRVMELSLRIASVMWEEGLPVLPFHPRSTFRRISGEIVCDLSAVMALMDLNLIPLTHGDLIYDDEMGVYVLSADEIPIYLVPMGLREAVFLTDVPGVLNEDGEVIPEITEAKIPDLGGSTFDVTGAMKGKLEAAFQLAKLGVKVRIAGFTKRGDLIRALSGESGTLVRV